MRLKLDNKSFMSNHARLIKVTATTAPSDPEGNKISKKTNEYFKTGKVIARVAVMYLLKKADVNLRSNNSNFEKVSLISDEISRKTIKKSCLFGKIHEISRKK